MRTMPKGYYYPCYTHRTTPPVAGLFSQSSPGQVWGRARTSRYTASPAEMTTAPAGRAEMSITRRVLPQGPVSRRLPALSARV